jgi:predicted ATPase/class 3 adenylate cyclase/DNA-binding CsgD family transcriptional regulator
VARLPEGTVTFLLTDLQGSTGAWERQPKGMRSAMARHDAILANTVANHTGVLVEAGREGDSVLAAFKTSADAAACALEIQKSFGGESWPEGLDLKVRIALHTGEAQLRGDHYFGPALNRCARLLATCHPGQILLTKATESMLADELPPGAEVQDLGLHRLKDLARPEQVFQLKEVASLIEFPPIRSLPHQQTNLPRYLDTFVGRSAELAALKSSLAKSRLVTLTGAGGSGKTRLAAELGRACLGDWPGGVWWVDLAPVDDPRQMPGAVVGALRLPGQGPAQEVVNAWLAGRKAVLVLDNCEHLVAACAGFCQVALERSLELTIIATSREALGVPGEVRWPVLAMSTDEAVQLFQGRAQLVVPNYKVASSNLQTVNRICERVDGMPLAIELAAARMDVLSEQEILSQLSNRFRLLTVGSRTAPQRQQTMMATIDWSYRLLTEGEALLFRRLAVFRGGLTLEAAQSVCDNGIEESVLDLVAGLVRKSMLVTERAAGARTRYRLLESQLAYAEDRLRECGELELIRRRHYEYFKESLAAKAADSIGLPRASVARADWITQESGNLWAALRWARNNVDDLGLSLAADFEFSDFTQARSLLADLLANSPMQGLPRLKALADASFFAREQGDYEAAYQAAEKSVALAREIGEVGWEAFALNQTGAVHTARGELALAAKKYEEATSLVEDSISRRRQDSPWLRSQLSMIRNAVGMLSIYAGDFRRASDILTECVSTVKADGDVRGTANYLDSLAFAQLGLNDNEAAAVSWREAISISRGLNDDIGIVYGLVGLSLVAGAVGNDLRALRLASAVNRMSRARSLEFGTWVNRQAEDSQRQSRSRLGTRKSEEAWKQGWAMSVDQAIDYALRDSEPETAVDAGPLSIREQGVAKLIAAGLTNREIAERLFISERTAESHVERIRNKLDVRSRTEIATWAVEHGLAKTVPTNPGFDNRTS